MPKEIKSYFERSSRIFGQTPDHRSLEDLIQQYLEKTEKLEGKEEKVLQQMELMQIAVASLQQWSRSREQTMSEREPSKEMVQESSEPPSPEPERLNLEEIEEETRQIKEETKRIQKEVQQKMEENAKLQEEVNKRKKNEKDLSETLATENFRKAIERKFDEKTDQRQEIETCNLNSRASFKTDHKSLEEEIYKSDEEFIEILNNDDEAKIKYFDRKVKRLQTMQSNLKRKLDEESAVDKRKRENLQNKIEMLEWETEMDKHMIHKMKKKLGKK